MAEIKDQLVSFSNILSMVILKAEINNQNQNFLSVS